MEFDRNVAKLVGTLLEKSPNFLTSVVKVFDGVDDPKKLLVVLLLNTDAAVDVTKLSTEQKCCFRHLQDSSPKVSVDDFSASFRRVDCGTVSWSVSPFFRWRRPFSRATL